ncbi:MaoC family dehydratase N-terminal domain-containing protein [Cupriavidus necator]|jgi:acyl dehydratase|uniref:MaoC family dehydratase n=1 Tax=Cupriavidus necator TaxID=106590 RepID=A0A367PCB2_CUPNE|nr:MaoC family dehydratase N-terminal domain-containing protein [Cupriavidus necator]QQX85567.1 MaoC family dehydratase N-terminal domain-containing protein [Cupriavidus necator]RCJ05500.1 MaoC family dehydratase [Cupriavidus necator]
MIDKKHIGRVIADFRTSAPASQLRFFAKATGQTDPVYTDEAAARDAGHPGLPLPPTFLFSLELVNPPTGWRDELGIKVERILHGEQSFTYHRMAYAGDTLHFKTTITDIYDKKGGALDFVVRETRVTNQNGEHVADLRGVLVQRNG